MTLVGSTIYRIARERHCVASCGDMRLDCIEATRNARGLERERRSLSGASRLNAMKSTALRCCMLYRATTYNSLQRANSSAPAHGW